jgi:nucleotide-binding universal stress UspA family protein
VLCYAGRFAGSLGAKLTVVHAIPGSTASMGSLYFDPDWTTQLTKVAHDRIEFQLGNLGLQAGIAIESGEPANVVRDVARKSDADLVVIGRGSAEHAHGHLPSSTYAVVRESPCPVMAL